MSENQIYFPTMKSLHKENLTLYHELNAYIETIPGGPWHFVDGHDPSHCGERYAFTFSSIMRRGAEMGVTAIKDGPYFSFSCNAMPMG